jgi:hypothetical protein
MKVDAWRKELQERGEASLGAFVDAHPDYSIDDEQPECRGGTHFITFGSFRGEPVVFKYYDGDPRKDHEKRALELFAPTGLVPRLYPDDTDVLLVMQRLPGVTMDEAEERLTPVERDELYCRLGAAVATVVDARPGGDMAARSHIAFRAVDMDDFYSTRFHALTVLYREADTTTFFDVTLARAARVLRDRDVPHKETLARSLAALTQHRDAILAYPSFVHMDDFHTNNIMADGPTITGFIDLEMTRRGNEVLLLGAALASMRRRPAAWRSFRRGYEAARGAAMDDAMLSLVRSAAPFSTWIRFTWYWSTDGLPWWATDMDLRTSAVRDINDIVEALEQMPM